ncbi:MAG: hypothetical protein K0Q72_3508 [Armatimonadetes bacterium]|nr:hypothetical protein [Armatimonadota bacterium]
MSPPDRYTCEDAFRRLDDYLDRELSAREVERVDEHLRLCTVCAQEYVFEASVLRQVREKLERISLPEGLLGRISLALTATREDRQP